MGYLAPLLVVTGAGLLLAERLTRRATFPPELRYLVVTSQQLPNMPPQNLWPSLQRLHGMLLGIKKHAGPMRVTSGYRSPAVNAAAGGVEDSLHMAARAVDLVLPSPAATQRLFDILRSDPAVLAGLVQELILYVIEGTASHLHIAMPAPDLEPTPTIQIVRRSGGQTVAGINQLARC